GATHALIERNADVNAQDADGNTPLHLAIQGGHMTVVSLLLSHPGLDLRLRNARGATPFASAMESRSQRVAQAIVDREPTAPELRDNQGRNFLHKAVLKADLDSVLFLISISADVNSRVRDQTELAPLHLCVAAPSTDATSSVARHLLLAGADPNARTSGQRRTPLHLACAAGNCDLAGILLENESVEVNCTDDGGETPLHLAMREGHLPVCRLLLQQHRRPRPQLLSAANIHAAAPAGSVRPENAASIFDCVMAAEPQTSVDLPDAEGNTALLLAYIQGNVRLCTALVRAGASLGAINKYGKTVFNHQ
uniref:ANK_REP_REGION domain-containing protein n=1 Tax=Macrostomum lignano TaxID=282301 RepID=A0A1I8FEG4_9PLAT